MTRRYEQSADVCGRKKIPNRREAMEEIRNGIAYAAGIWLMTGSLRKKALDLLFGEDDECQENGDR